MVLDLVNAAWLAAPRVLAAPPVPGGPGGGQPIGAPGQGAGQASPAPFFGPQILLLMVGVFVLMMFLSGGAARKEKKKRAAMMSALGKHDRVQTAGGIIGTIVELKDDEIVLRVDETTNTRIRFAKASVTSVLRKGKGADSPVEEAVAQE